jgi:hypothetical protein
VVPAPPAVLTPEGWGKVRIGMTEADAAVALHGAEVSSDQDPSGACHLMYPARGKGLYLLTEDGLVTSIIVWDHAPVRTDKGLGLGSTEAQVRAAYGSKLKVAKAPYLDEPAHTLTAWTIKDKAGIRYTTDENCL